MSEPKKWLGVDQGLKFGDHTVYEFQHVGVDGREFVDHKDYDKLLAALTEAEARAEHRLKAYEQCREEKFKLLAELAAVTKERDEWKWEYENACKFATDYEQQRDRYKSALESIKSGPEHPLLDEMRFEKNRAIFVAQFSQNIATKALEGGT